MLEVTDLGCAATKHLIVVVVSATVEEVRIAEPGGGARRRLAQKRVVVHVCNV